jgi:hypothetical protein
MLTFVVVNVNFDRNIHNIRKRITEVLKFKDHLKNLVTEMDYNNISIKLLEEEFPQEDSKVKVTLC